MQQQSNSYKYISLDMTQLNKKNKAKRKVRRDDDLEIEFESSLAPGRNDSLRESMLAYTKRMNDIRRIRGINWPKQVDTMRNMSQLWIASKSVQRVDSGSEKKNYTTHNRLPKSLGSIKLEPLLGARRIPTDGDYNINSSLRTYKVERSEPTHQVDAVKVNHITVTIAIPAVDQSDERPLTYSQTTPVLDQKEHVPVKNVKAQHRRPRKAKRMKISEPSLESIIEVGDETSAHCLEMEESYSHLLTDVQDSHELMLQQKRRTVSLLRTTNYSQKSSKQSRQSAITKLAKKKFRKLPPIPSGGSFKYTNGDSPARNMYSDV